MKKCIQRYLTEQDNENMGKSKKKFEKEKKMCSEV